MFIKLTFTEVSEEFILQLWLRQGAPSLGSHGVFGHNAWWNLSRYFPCFLANKFWSQVRLLKNVNRKSNKIQIPFSIGWKWLVADWCYFLMVFIPPWFTVPILVTLTVCVQFHMWIQCFLYKAVSLGLRLVSR